MSAAPRRLEATLSAFADRLFVTGGRDPGDGVVPLPPARLELYRSLVRGGYRSMLRFAFTYSLVLVDRELEAAAGGDGLPQDADAVVARFLEVSPARTHSIREIADRFLVFLPREVPRLFQRRSDLLDLMTLERAELGALFHVDDPGRVVEADEADAIAAGPLDGLLARTVLRAPSASLLRLAHPVVALRASLEREEPPAPAESGHERAGVGRRGAPRFGVEFVALTEEGLLALEAALPGEPLLVERLADRWFAKLSPEARERDDAWKASAFSGAVLAGLRAGILRAN